MKRIASFLFGLALLLGSVPAYAAASVAVSKQQWCSPPQTSGSLARSVTNPQTGGGTYSLDTHGCALMTSQDWAYFQSQGYTQGSGSFAIYAGPFTAQTTTANSPVLPANAYIEGIIIQETTGNAITGGIDIGIAGSSDATIVSAFAIGANCVCAITDAALLKKVFPTSGTTGPAAQQIFFNAHTNWTDAASINVTILYRYF